MPPRNWLLGVCCGISLLGTSAAWAEKPSAPAETPLGFAAAKPASGPAIATPHGFMTAYTATIPGTEVSFDMLPIPGGKFTLGSPTTEPDRKPDEGPQVEVELPPFWMGRHEVTWAEYKQYMALYLVLKELHSLRTTLGDTDEKKREQREKLQTALPKYPALAKRLGQPIADVDAITAPTKLYEPTFTFEHGEDPKQPAITMTQYAAKQYTKWLSRMTGHFYAIPSEAQWEYACRAGTHTAYSFGNEASQLDDHAWYEGNSEETTHLVEQKKPNPWGLFDMHGNVAEWTLDAYTEKGYTPRSGTVDLLTAIDWPESEFPRVVRGGQYGLAAKYSRSASRFPSHDTRWKSEDPNLPRSPWWFTTDPARGVGFRLVRWLEPPAKELHDKFWGLDNDAVRFSVQERLREGRGVDGTIDPELPAVMQQLRDLRQQLETGG